MINSISLSSVATYASEPQIMKQLSRLNFIFGFNGSGKTTITRVIADEQENYPSCEIRWQNGTTIQTLVYNQSFIENNFNESTEFKGVFTLGEDQVQTLTDINNIKSDIVTLDKKINSLTETLKGKNGTSGKKGELDELEDQLSDKCWKQKQKYDGTLKGGFQGYRNDKKKFKEKVLQEFSKMNQTILCDIKDLENRASSIFSKMLIHEELVPEICLSLLIKHESNPILTKRIIGKEDVNIAAMIERLDNSDWVRQGKKYLEINNSICPFCQQNTDESFSKSLEDYFDETFIADINEIEKLSSQYTTDAKEIQKKLSNILANPSRFLNVEQLDNMKRVLDFEIRNNQQCLERKKKEAIRSVELKSLKDIAKKIAELIETTNEKINTHNQMINNNAEEGRILTEQIWRFVVKELNDDLEDYRRKKHNLKQAIDNLSLQVTEKEKEKSEKSSDLRKLEKQITSIQPTIDVINNLLKSFGFANFSLAKASEESYKLVRADGRDAKSTLSEGEKSFVTFLYFYHLLKGSTSESGMTTDRVVVIDDPVSSLDAHILFIVSSLIKELFKEIRDNKGCIKQIFILTHNVYFHKEVTFNSKRTKEQALTDETFWIIRKSDNGSKFEKHESNPIKTSYQLLWSEVGKSDDSKLTIQNTLRRILENYFKILGGINPEDICSKFDGADRVICKSLFSWLNDGSHSVHDDINIAVDSNTVERNLKIFREIFEKSGHSAHYKMMMGNDATE